MLKPLTIAACLALTACAGMQEQPTTWAQTEAVRDSLTGEFIPMTVTWHLDEDNRISDKCVELGTRWDNRGCAVFYPSNPSKKCSIYTPFPKSPQDLNSMKTVLHELLHCLLGAWHD